MFDGLTDPFSGEIGGRALAEVILLGLVCGPLGAWVVLFRQSYAAESIAHAALPGLVLAAVAGLPLLLGAAGGLLTAAIAIGLAGRERNVGPDTAVAVVVTTLFGAGVLLALQPEVPARLGEILFGDPLSVSTGEIAATAGLAAVVLTFLAGFHRSLALAGFDPQAARSLGVRPRSIELVLLVLLAGATLVAVQALGNLLVVALLLAPGAAALRLNRALAPTLALAAILAVLAGMAGLYASYYLELAAGASIALAAVVTFALATLWPPLRGGAVRI
jgi:ABC-type Mn2+/Zn2+ transport system permease subunit